MKFTYTFNLPRLTPVEYEYYKLLVTDQGVLLEVRRKDGTYEDHKKIESGTIEPGQLELPL